MLPRLDRQVFSTSNSISAVGCSRCNHPHHLCHTSLWENVNIKVFINAYMNILSIYISYIFSYIYIFTHIYIYTSMAAMINMLPVL